MGAARRRKAPFRENAATTDQLSCVDLARVEIIEDRFNVRSGWLILILSLLLVTIVRFAGGADRPIKPLPCNCLTAPRAWAVPTFVPQCRRLPGRSGRVARWDATPGIGHEVAGGGMAAAGFGCPGAGGAE